MGFVIALFGLVLLLALLSIPFGVPGIWIMIAAALGMVWLSPVGHAGWLVIGRTLATATKVGAGVVIAVILLAAVVF